MTMSISILRFGGLSYSVASSDLVTVTLGVSENGSPFAERVEAVTPTPEQWATFWETVRPFQTWGREYVDPDVLDGTQWSVLLDSGEFHVHSSGSNAYPEGWPRFMDALRHLTGGRLYD